LVGGSGRLLAEGFVGPFVIELVAEGIEAALLSPEVSFRWSGGARFERAVHAFVAAVVLRLAGLDELGEDAEADPPDREGGEAAEGVGGEGGTVVGADALRQAVLAKEALEDGSGAFDSRNGESLAAEEEATEAVLHGEGIAVKAVAQAKLALEVGTPDGVGLIDRSGGSAGMRAAHATALGWYQAVAIEDSVDGAYSRRATLGKAILKQPLQLGGAPAAAASKLENGLNDLERSGVTAGMGPVGAIGEPLRPMFLEAMEPFVAALATHTVATAEFSEGEEAALGVDHEVEPFVHG